MTLSALRKELLGKIDQVDARIIVRLATGLDEIHQITESGMEISKEMYDKAESLLRMRLEGIPMAYITGEKEFFGHTFHVNPSVLIPRPDTETLVETAIKLARNFREPRILDLCTGSGAVGTSIAYALSRDVAISDLSENALKIAAENYLRITGKQPDARLGNLLAPWKGSVFDIIATNPPYLTDRWYEETEISVKKEPEMAFLGGGDDGLAIIREIIASSPDFLSPNGVLAIECDYRQIEICGSLLKINGFSDIHIVKDLGDKERVIYGRRLPE